MISHIGLLTKPQCLAILQKLPTICPPRPTKQDVRELRFAISLAYSAGGEVRALIEEQINAL